MAMGRVFFLTYTATPEIYTLSLHDALPISAHARPAAPSVADRWIRSRLNATVGLVRKALDGYRFNDAASALYHFTWHEVCDWYLEIAKLALYDRGNAAQRARTQATLVEVLEAT